MSLTSKEVEVGLTNLYVSLICIASRSIRVVSLFLKGCAQGFVWLPSQNPTQRAQVLQWGCCTEHMYCTLDIWDTSLVRSAEKNWPFTVTWKSTETFIKLLLLQMSDSSKWVSCCFFFYHPILFHFCHKTHALAATQALHTNRMRKHCMV